MAYERKYKVTSTLQDSYDSYKEEFGEVNKKLYLAIAYEILKTISDKIIRESLEYRMPSKMGFLRIKKNKQKLVIKDGKIDRRRNIPNWKATWEAWHKKYPDKTREEIKQIPDKGIIFQKNYHTDGHIMRWFWDRKFSNARNSSVYSFDPVKGGIKDGIYMGRLGLASWIKSGKMKNDYYY